MSHDPGKCTTMERTLIRHWEKTLGVHSFIPRSHSRFCSPVPGKPAESELGSEEGCCDVVCAYHPQQTGVWGCDFTEMDSTEKII